MKTKTLFYNARVHTQAAALVVDSIAIHKGRIVAIGNNLQHDPDFRSYAKLDMKGRTIIPGLVDAHTHLYYFAKTLRNVDLDGVDSLGKCLVRIKRHSEKLGRNEWVLGNGFSHDRFKKVIVPTRFDLDQVTGGRPAFISSKDEHTAWVNSKALEMAGIDANTCDPEGGRIERLPDGTPSGILRENSAYDPVYDIIPAPSRRVIDQCYRQVLDIAYRKGVTGVHSMDSPDAFEYYSQLAEKGKVGLRINYYMSAEKLSELLQNKIYYGTGTDFFRLAGIKIFTDGALGSQTAHCFNKYTGSKDNYGLAVNSDRTLQSLIKKAARLGLPCAIHAIGDRAVSRVLDAFETAPRLDFGARHRIEHMQLIRRKDISRVKRLNVIGSMQPSHCPSDITLMRRFWGARDANAFVFRTLIDRGIDLAFGSDCPIEPLNPMAGIAAAVRRARPKSRDIFYPEQRISAAEALYRFTVGPAIAAGQQHCRGYLLPGYPADIVVLSEDPTRVAASRIADIEVLATILDGKPKYAHVSLGL
ncbi:MAG: amidohydrolase [candidate division Zixibacteria bacterium]|nr:amidohydrolase [candidate division Zixibacteria bacterium]